MKAHSYLLQCRKQVIASLICHLSCSSLSEWQHINQSPINSSESADVWLKWEKTDSPPEIVGRQHFMAPALFSENWILFNVYLFQCFCVDHLNSFVMYSITWFKFSLSYIQIAFCVYWVTIREWNLTDNVVWWQYCDDTFTLFFVSLLIYFQYYLSCQNVFVKPRCFKNESYLKW